MIQNYVIKVIYILFYFMFYNMISAKLYIITLFDLDSCAIFMSKKSYVKQTGHGYSIARRPV